MNTESIPYKTYLTESEVPTAWYNLRADMKVKPAPLLNPGTLKPVTAEELEHVFCKELVKQELDDTTAYIPIPEEAREDLLQVRGQQHVRLAQAQQRRGAGVLREGAGAEGRDHGDGRRPVGHRALDGVRVLRARLPGVHGEVLVRAEAVPPRGDAHVRRGRDAVPVDEDERGPRDQRGASGNDRFARLRDLRGGGGCRHAGWLPLRARLGARAGAAAPVDHRP